MSLSSPLTSPSPAGYLSSDATYMTAPASPNWHPSDSRQDSQPSSSSSFAFLPSQQFSSPDTTPAAQAALTARRNQFYQLRAAHLSHPRYTSGNQSRPVRRSSETFIFSQATPEKDSPTRQVWRTKFRERCRMQMARDRARALARTRGGAFQSFQDDEIMLTPGAGPREPMPGSDDLPSSSDIDVDFEDESPGAWQREDEELIRRVILAEYRRIKRQHEESGEREVGWLDADEVSYLEEEMRREVQQHSSTRPIPRQKQQDLNRTPTRNTGSSWHPGTAPMFRVPSSEDGSQQPPEDMADEDEFYFQKYLEHHRAPQGMDQDDDWDQLDHNFEAQLANLPMP